MILVRPEHVGAWIAWPRDVRGFRLLVAMDEDGTSLAEEYHRFARSAVAAGASSALCLGAGAADLEDAFLDAARDTDVIADVFSTRSTPNMPLDEALWHTWYVPPLQGDEQQTIVVCLFDGDARLVELPEFAVDLEDTFKQVLDREP